MASLHACMQRQEATMRAPTGGVGGSYHANKKAKASPPTHYKFRLASPLTGELSFAPKAP